MAIETQRQKHLFLPTPLLSEPSTKQRRREREIKVVTKQKNSRGSDEKPRKWFKPNFFHDLESVAWMYAYFLLTTKPSFISFDGLTSAPKIVQQIREELFDGNVAGSLPRSEFLQAFADDEDVITSALTPLYADLPGGPGLISAVEIFRDLVFAYYKLEATTPLDLDKPESTRWDPLNFGSSTYASAYDVFDDVREKMESAPFKAVKWSDGERPAPDDTEQRSKKARTRK